MWAHHQKSLQNGGMSMKDYVHIDGEKGSYMDKLKVYNQKEDPLGNPVKAIKGKHGRTMWIVEKIQMPTSIDDDEIEIELL